MSEQEDVFVHYAFLLTPHPNARYRQSLRKLAQAEAACLLTSWAVPYEKLQIETICGREYLTFSAPELSPGAWESLSSHSGVCFTAERLSEDLLRPIAPAKTSFFPAELPYVLKYKGKTSPDFTFLMLHCAKAASAFAHTQTGLTVLDPMCGKGTSLFCALCEGHQAVGIETDKKALQEADVYLERFLQMNRMKFQRTVSSCTVKDGSVSRTRYEIAQSAQARKEGYVSSAEWFNADAAAAGSLIKKNSCHLVLCDLPYGVQHAPKENGEISTFRRLLDRVLSGCVQSLLPGGAAAFSFNLNTLKRADLISAMASANLTVLTEPPWDDFSHWVEQAVDRDLVIAVKESNS